MSEREIDSRRNWKAQVFPLDYYLPDESEECLYCLTDKQAEILRGIIEPLAWKTRWWSDDDNPIDVDQITTFRDDLTRRLMMPCGCDDQPILYRWTVDSVLQKSIDGGTTWEDAPENDPRNYSTVYPPMAGSDGLDKRCIAATSAAQLIKAQVGDQLTDDMSRFTLDELIKTWVGTYIQTSNPFLALINIAVNQIFALVISALRAALTDAVYDILQCIIYCNIGNDASVTDAQWAAIRSDITDQIGGIAGVFLEHLIYLLGRVGTTNICRSGFATEGDCEDCGSCVPGCENDWIVYPNSPNYFGVIVHQTSTYIIVRTDVINTNGLYYTYLRAVDNDHCCVINHTTYVLATTDESLMTYDNMLENGTQTNVFGAECGSSIPSGSMGAFSDDHCLNQVQYQAVGQYAIMYTKDAC